jgi:hypothetical protein
MFLQTRVVAFIGATWQGEKNNGAPKKMLAISSRGA